MGEWEKLIAWFNILKKNCGVTIPDTFAVNSGKVDVIGEKLPEFMELFWKNEGVTLHDFPIGMMEKRMRLKSHLMAFLSVLDQY